MGIARENIITFAAFFDKMIINCQTMKRLTFCAIMVIVSLSCAAQTEIRRPECAIAESDWERIHTKPDYFLQILSIQDSLMAGHEVSATHLQELMPRTYEDFRIFIVIENYCSVKIDGVCHELDKNILVEIFNFAKADTLDMMERYVEWLKWSDGWAREMIYIHYVYIEEQHPEKFQRLLKSIAPQWYDDYVAYRDEYIKWRDSQ